MVARILTGNNIRGLLNYNETKVENNSATLILAHRFGLDIEELELRHKVARFEHLTKLNSRVKTNAVHIMLNFDPFENLDINKLQLIAGDYMEQIGFGDQPYLVYQHFDAGHPHIHLVTTNMKSDGERIDLHNIGKSLSEQARKEIEKKYGLVRAEGKQLTAELRIKAVDPETAAYGTKPTKKAIYNVLIPVLRHYAFTSFEEFNAVLKVFNIAADRGSEGSKMFENRGLVYSVLDSRGDRTGIPIKASSFPGRPTLDRVEAKFFRNRERGLPFKILLKYKIENVLKNFTVTSREGFIAEMQRNQVSVLFRENEDGRVYGVTYIDHKNHVVFNGSDLGKVFSAKGLLERIDNRGRSAATASVNIREIRPGEPVRWVNKERNTIDAASDGKKVLDILMDQADYAPVGVIGKIRKKRKKKGKTNNNDFGHNL
jgi:hypothetical protein